MKRILALLPTLQSALRPIAVSISGSTVSPRDVDVLIRGIERKAKFAEIHRTILGGIDWDQIDGIGRTTDGLSGVNSLVIQLKDASLRVSHPQALNDHVYMAFDGLMAALVNMTDTLGRLLNLVYALGINPKQASLLAVRDRCGPNSPLGVVLTDPQQMDWFKPVRNLRGRCQHEAIEEVLMQGGGAYSRKGQPHVPAEFCWNSPQQPMLLLPFVEVATRATTDCLIAVIGAVLKSPQYPHI